MKDKETRNFSIDAIAEGRTIEGFIPYNSRSESMGFYETLKPGCFSKTLRESKDILALYGHEGNSILARTKNGSLKFEDRDDGLHFSFEMPDTTQGNDVLEMVRSGLIDGCSFGFSAVKEDHSMDGGKELRTIVEARLYEISIVPQPAYPETHVSARSLSEAMKEKETLDEADIQSVREEIDALASLLPKEEEPAQPVADDPEPSHEEASNQPAAMEEQLQTLADKLSKLEEILDEVEHES